MVFSGSSGVRFAGKKAMDVRHGYVIQFKASMNNYTVRFLTMETCSHCGSIGESVMVFSGTSGVRFAMTNAMDVKHGDVVQFKASINKLSHSFV